MAGDSVQTFYTTVSGTTRIVLPVRQAKNESHGSCE